MKSETEWRSLFGVLIAQGLTSVAGAVAGLIVVRALPIEAYARYSVALALLGAISLLADSGTTMGAMAQGGKVWQDPRRLGAVLRVARSLRLRFGLWAGAVALPVLVALLAQQGASTREIAAWVVVIGGLFILNLQTSLLEVPVKLHQALRVTQGVAVGQSVLRVGAVVAAVGLWPFGVVAALAGGLPQAWGNWRLARAGRSFIAEGGETDPHVRKDMLALVRRSLPGGIYYVVSQQAGLWFLSVGGSTVAVAQLGALGRIALIVGVIGALAQAVWVPRFARIPDNGPLLSGYVRTLGWVVALALPAGLLAVVWPTGLLWLVGPAYVGLEGALRLAVCGAVLQMLGGVALQLVYGRGWLPPPVVGIGIAVAVQAACVGLLDLRTLEGVLWMGVFLGLQTLVVHVGYLLYKVRTLRAKPVV